MFQTPLFYDISSCHYNFGHMVFALICVVSCNLFAYLGVVFRRMAICPSYEPILNYANAVFIVFSTREFYDPEIGLFD